MPLPTFIVIGASRSGTTSLHHYLGQHSNIFMCPRKSPNFFVSEDPLPAREGPVARQMAGQWVSSRESYEALFSGARDGDSIGEVSPVYLQSWAAPERIRGICPEARFVAILRDPAERAWAHYMGRIRDGLDDRENFEAVIEAELAEGLPDDVAFGSYLGCSRYGHFLSRYLELFPREQIRVYLFEDLCEAPRDLLGDIFSFLGVEPSPSASISMSRHHQSGQVRGALRRFLWTRSVGLRTTLRPMLPEGVRRLAAPLFLKDLDKPRLRPDLRARICDVLAPDIERCQEQIARDLTRWLEP
jgi:hypothetical protein